MTTRARHVSHPLRRGARGLSMIEVLVATVVLAIGLLGLAGLQVSGIKVAQGSTLRWKASEVAAELADRMRANRAGFVAGAGTLFTVDASGQPGGNAPPTGGAADSLVDWARTRLVVLPGALAVAGVRPDGSTSISITWDDARASRIAVDTPGAPAAAPPAPGKFDLVTAI